MNRLPLAFLLLVGSPLVLAQTNAGLQPYPLMPWPKSISTASPAAITIDSSFSVGLAGGGAKDPRVTDAVDRLFVRLYRQTGIPIQRKIVAADGATLAIIVEKRDHRAPQRLGDNERYSLESAGSHIRLSADEPLGVLRGMETFLQLVRQNEAVNRVGTPGFSVPMVSIHDEPRFPWRGLSLDVSRHFIPVDNIKRTIDGLAAVKLNVLHWHLSDDQGFRVESRKYPLLQRDGSDHMFYTREEIKDILAYARDRGVRIVPEFDMPGHATSFLPGYPQLGTGAKSYEIVRGSGIFAHLLDPTKESTYRFLDGFVGEMAKLFPDQYFHIGGDEVDPKEWMENPRIRKFMQKHNLADGKALQTYFNKRLLKIVTKHSKHMEGWDEILQPDLPKTILVQSWRGQPSLWQGARQGFQGILSAGYYLDLMYPSWYHYSIDPMKAPGPAPDTGGAPVAPKPDEPLPGTPSGLTPDQAKLILGGEAAMWEELASPENVDAKLWPRLAAIAERFWSPESVTDVPSMYRRLYVTNNWLQWLGLTQRTNLELMRQRLVGSMPYQPLDTVASLLEPVKGYSREAEKYTIFSPLNTLVDSIPPESQAARRFRDDVEAYLASGSHNPEQAKALREELQQWTDAAQHVEQMCDTIAVLAKDRAAIDAVASLSQTGLDALSHMEGSARPDANWKQRAGAAVSPYLYQRVGDLIIPIAPAIQKLVAAVPAQ
ncbi:MAG TPA: beta-N-acetylhexosaminidase [Bryobacteraceae bacterium]|nr:beta-N-acetylhexosaminidase [Bryobacteraceae bacterium]